VHIGNFQLQERASFLDYIMGGCEINVHVAIDFTQSNGEIKSPDSLHYMPDPSHQNDYVRALSSIIKVLKNYDHD
jgi:hypothetical protein